MLIYWPRWLMLILATVGDAALLVTVGDAVLLAAVGDVDLW